jgi:hypothetical protein
VHLFTFGANKCVAVQTLPNNPPREENKSDTNKGRKKFEKTKTTIMDQRKKIINCVTEIEQKKHCLI